MRETQGGRSEPYNRRNPCRISEPTAERNLRAKSEPLSKRNPKNLSEPKRMY
jgi:hypothetical protein